MRANYGLDRLAEHGVGPVPETVSMVNPERRKLDSSIRKTTAQRNLLVQELKAHCNAKFGGLSLEGPLDAQATARDQN